MCFGDLVVLTVSGVLLTISTVPAGYFAFLVVIGVSSDDGRVIVEAYFEFFAVMETVGVVGIVKFMRVVGVIMAVIEASDGM